MNVGVQRESINCINVTQLCILTVAHIKANIVYKSSLHSSPYMKDDSSCAKDSLWCSANMCFGLCLLLHTNTQEIAANNKLKGQPKAP